VPDEAVPLPEEVEVEGEDLTEVAAAPGTEEAKEE